MLEFNIKKISIFGICKFLIICFVCPKKTYIYIYIYWYLLFIIIINLIFISAIPKGTTDQMHMVLHVVADGKSYCYYYYLTFTLITPMRFSSDIDHTALKSDINLCE